MASLRKIIELLADWGKSVLVRILIPLIPFGISLLILHTFAKYSFYLVCEPIFAFNFVIPLLYIVERYRRGTPVFLFFVVLATIIQYLLYIEMANKIVFAEFVKGMVLVGIITSIGVTLITLVIEFFKSYKIIYNE